MKAYWAIGCALLMAACNNASDANTSTKDSMQQATKDTISKGITRADWGEADGQPVYLYTLTNSKGSQVKISNYGGIVTSWLVPDKQGKMSDIVMGYNNLKGYQTASPYFGALVGRYGNRIGNAQFKIDGKTYKLAANNGKASLHGGNKGFDKMVWAATPDDRNNVLTLQYRSPDGEEGYPGNLNVTVTYTYTDDNELQIAYKATTDKATPINLTNHSYFNLTGEGGTNILQHVVTIDADRYTPVDASLIPTGELKPVQGTPFDFTQPHAIGERIAQTGGGYDHNFVLNGSGYRKIATVQDSTSGRRLEVFTDQPGVQFYTGNFLDGSITGSLGKPIPKNGAFCLETQHFPDSPNQPSFPTTILKPGETFTSKTSYKISVE